MSDERRDAQLERIGERGEAMLDQIKMTNDLARRSVEASERQAAALEVIADALKSIAMRGLPPTS